MRTIRTKIVMAAHDAAGLTPPLPGLTPGAATQGEQMEISNTKQANRQMVKRGPEFMADMKKLADKEAGLTLQAVAEKHGLTRERIRQLFFILYGTPYTEAVNGKREHKKHIKLARKAITARQSRPNINFISNVRVEDSRFILTPENPYAISSSIITS